MNALMSVLFIGNSYVYYNDLPMMLEAMAHERGAALQTGVVAVGGFSLERHLQSGLVESALNGNEPDGQLVGARAVVRVPAETNWNWVVLQEQSLRPLENATKYLESAREISNAVTARGGQTLLFLTWARAEYPESQRDLNNVTYYVASEIGASVAPVGIAWERAKLQWPDLVLHVEDGSHPNEAGTYLAACVFFATLLQQNPQGLSSSLYKGRITIANLDPNLAHFLQRVAWEVTAR